MQYGAAYTLQQHDWDYPDRAIRSLVSKLGAMSPAKLPRPVSHRRSPGEHRKVPA